MENFKLDNYLELISDNLNNWKKSDSTIYNFIKEIDDHWLDLVFASKGHSDNHVQCVLMTNGHYFFRSAITLILTGKTAPIYPILRTSLESCMYASAIALKPKLEEIWLDRNKNELSKIICKEEFSPIKIFNLLNSQNHLLSKACKQFYDTYIDYGAHPNINGTTTFIELVHEAQSNSIKINYLQGDTREIRIAAFTTIQLAEIALHISLIAMPQRSEKVETQKFLNNFSPKINSTHMGI